MRRKLQTISSTRFTYHIESKTFVAEMSDFNLEPGIFTQQIYDDAADYGLCIVSSKTDAEVAYFHSDIKWNSEGEIVSWIYLPLPIDVVCHPLAAGTKVEIFND